MLIGAIEAGGTKFKCAVATSSGVILQDTTIKTTTVEETMEKVIKFFLAFPIKTMGVGCFGPICLDPSDERYGMILDTPKKIWANYNILKALKDALKCNVKITTDVNASAFGEYYYGYKKKFQNLVYVTIGTGIGGGIVYNGSLVQGHHHPEIGHMTLKRDSNDNYPSTCPFHSDCFEGLASGISLDKRYNLSYDELAKRDDLLRREANDIAQGIYNLYLTFAPDKIIIGGGVSHQEKLLPLVREEFEKLNNNYYTYKAVKSVDELIVSPTLKDNSALYGAIALGVIEK